MMDVWRTPARRVGRRSLIRKMSQVAREPWDPARE